MRCVLDAFCKAANISQEELLPLLGHDGSEIVFPDLPEPSCRRGFDPREIAYALYTHKGIKIMQFDRYIERISRNGESYILDMSEQLFKLMENNSGIIIGLFINKLHAVYWDSKIKNNNIKNRMIDVHSFFLILDNKE
jgi:hypothetical protein